MGIRSSKRKKQKITNYENIKIPTKCSLLKISSYNINIKNAINGVNKINDLILYITESYMNKTHDIICIQGLYDYKMAEKIIREIKQYIIENNINYYFAPEFDELKPMTDINMNTINNTKSSKTSSNRSKKNPSKIRYDVQNIIISRYPIITSIYAELDDNHSVDDIIGIKTIIGANVLVANNIISIYNTELSSDIKTADIDNSSIRDKELISIDDIIQENTKNISTSEIFNKYCITDIHLVIGTLNIPDITENDNMQDSEYLILSSKFKYIDIYRCLYDYTHLGHTNTSGERIDYILLYLTDDLYNVNTLVHKKFQKIDSTKGMLKFIFNRYNIHFIDMYMRTDINDDYTSRNYAIELICMLKH